jgi:flagellar hook-length control protein FliK
VSAPAVAGVPTVGTMLTDLGGRTVAGPAAPAAPATATPAADDSKGAAPPALTDTVCIAIAGGGALGGAEAAAACSCTAAAGAEVAVTAVEVLAEPVVTEVLAKAAIADDGPVRFGTAGDGAMAAPAGADAGMAGGKQLCCADAAGAGVLGPGGLSA